MTHWLTPDGYNVMLRGLMGDAIMLNRQVIDLTNECKELWLPK